MSALLFNELSTVCWNPSLRANGSRECAPDDRLRDEAIHTAKQEWIASSRSLSSGRPKGRTRWLLAMTR
jgi:hypothetical protein